MSIFTAGLSTSLRSGRDDTVEVGDAGVSASLRSGREDRVGRKSLRRAARGRGAWQRWGSAGAVNEKLGERLEVVGGVAEGLEGGEGVGDEVPGVCEGAVDTKDGGPGGLGGGSVLAGGFAELGGLGGDVEDVVDDLEGKAGALAEAAEAGDGGVGGAGDVATGDDGDSDEGAGLGAMDLLDELCGGRLALRLDVDDLAADHAGGMAGLQVDGVPVWIPVGLVFIEQRRLCFGDRADAGADGAGDFLEDVDGGDGGAVESGNGVESEGLEGVAGEDGDGVTEDLVAGGLAAAEVVVVEGGQVVVDEGVGVKHLEGGAELDGGGLGLNRRGVVLAGEAPGLVAEDGAKALATGEDGVSHGAMDRVRGGFGRGKQALEGVIGAIGASGDEL